MSVCLKMIKLPCGQEGVSCVQSCYHIILKGGYKIEYATKIDKCYKKHKKELDKKINLDQIVGKKQIL